MTTSTSTNTTSVTACVSQAWDESADDRFLSQSRCIDWLLDCLNASTTASVRQVVTESLAAISHLRLVKAQDFHHTLNHIQMAFQVDAVFDHMELTAS